MEENNDDFQKRYLLSLCPNDQNTKIVRTILKSPLGLSVNIIKLLFNNNFKEIKENLDSIKKFVAGITRAEFLGKSYTLARFYPYLFSFHQYFHSSYRARQGKALEEMFKELIRHSNSNFFVPDTNKGKNNIMSEVFKGYVSRLDIDVVAKKSKGNILALQLRSRDDTGGTTAKASLVEALREVMKKDIEKRSNLFYLIGIWDKINSNQKNITISKIYDSLKPYFSINILKEQFVDTIENGVEVRKGIVLKLAHGNKKIVKNVAEWVGPETDLSYTDMSNIIKTLEDSDDLWLSYAIASLELENIRLRGFNNIDYLNKLLKAINYNLSSCSKNDDYLNLANTLALKIIPKWNNNFLPVSSMAEKATYIRDLILLRFIYDISCT
jgi:hypothetical protein